MIYYNEFDKKKAAMLRQLMIDGLIPMGVVDDRSIKEVQADELREYTQCHFFAGVGLWSVALDLAGWDTTRPVWTGSCPCQPFSSAGRQKAQQDDRHLWPEWYRLISECSPPTIFGEQVASAITKGWLDGVYNDLEVHGYAVGSAVLPACSVGAPHKRDRLWFVGNTNMYGCEPTTSDRDNATSFSECSQRSNEHKQSTRAGVSAHVADTDSSRLQGYRGHEQQHDSQGWQEQDGYPWASDVQFILCPDGKARPVEPRIPLLVDGYPHRVPILHAIGDGIVPQVAAEFIKATM